MQSPSPSEHISEDPSVPAKHAEALGPDLTPLIAAADAVLAENAENDGGTNP